MTHRGYNPRTGRFLSRDPIGYEGGINLYAYAGNNPVTHADPSGLQAGSSLNFVEEGIQYTFSHPVESFAASTATLEALTTGTATTVAGVSVAPVVFGVAAFTGALWGANSLGHAIANDLYDLTVMSAEEADQPLFSKIPDAYLNAKFSVDMTPGPRSKLTTNGHPRDNRWFWKQMLAKYPRLFSTGNQTRIKDGLGPKVDAQWIRDNPSHAKYKGDLLIHHHLNQGHRAAGLPEKIHRRYHGALHPQR